ncbi:MAG: hypothetical protein U0W24_16475 [Bacteroidales bacterium]
MKVPIKRKGFGIVLCLKLSAIGFAFQFFACNEESPKKIITEGEIKYEIEYLDDQRSNSLIPLLPNEMTTSFKPDATRTLIEGLFGTFKLIYILNQPAKTNYTLLQILDKKYVYQSPINDLAFGYQDMRKVKIVYSDKVKRIAGFKCKNAKAIIQNGKSDTVDIYFTKEIGLKYANINNPFKEIDGVLMEFTVNLVDINMKFTARKVIEKKVENKYFELPSGFVSITEERMHQLINDYNQSSSQ